MEEVVEKKIEIKGIGFLSTFKLFFGMFLVMSLILFLSVQIFGQQLLLMIGTFMSSIMNVVNQILMKFPILVTNPVIGSVVFSLLYGFIMSLFFAIGAGIYTIFAMLIGGIKIKIKETSDVVSPFK